ncbi:hypothetical protein B0H63DRAFT_556622 [Podospora didyma]|uniref:Myb-like DNA-binding protein n=1 Tax=Podospora didyma TaxID=330526 RepID=A0AAE0NXC1_9PEZI|nr:hypothetical protein B0H63DRAFT_556622 [Podospora didyma]
MPLPPDMEEATPSRVSDSSFTSASPQKLRAAVNSGIWSAEEDQRLRDAVGKLGTRWLAVAIEVGTRNGEQCAKRWNDNVNPELDHSPWSAEEDKLILPLVALYGHNWKLISQSFPQARAPLSIKNRYSLLMRRQKRQNAKQQQRSLATTRDKFLDLRDAPPFNNYPACKFSVAAVNTQDVSLPSSNSPAVPAQHVPTNPSMDPSKAFLGSPVMGQHTAFSPDHISEDAVQQQQQQQQLDQTSFQGTGWDDQNGIFSSIDFDQFFDSADMSIQPAGADSMMLNVHGVGDGGNKGVEFSVTCSRSKLKAMVCHAFEGAMVEAAGLSEEDPVTVTLRLMRW